jgi:hypothetical protein
MTLCGLVYAYECFEGHTASIFMAELIILRHMGSMFLPNPEDHITNIHRLNISKPAQPTALFI